MANTGTGITQNRIYNSTMFICNVIEMLRHVKLSRKGERNRIETDCVHQLAWGLAHNSSTEACPKTQNGATKTTRANEVGMRTKPDIIHVAGHTTTLGGAAGNPTNARNKKAIVHGKTAMGKRLQEWNSKTNNEGGENAKRAVSGEGGHAIRGRTFAGHAAIGGSVRVQRHAPQTHIPNQNATCQVGNMVGERRSHARRMRRTMSRQRTKGE